MFEEFMIRAFTGGMALSIASGPVGCFILWKRLAYFGDTLAHSALLGVALAIFLDINSVFAVFVLAVLISMGLLALRNMRIFSADAALGILSHTSLALGLILISLFSPAGFQLNSLLFGDVLALNWQDVWVAIFVAFVILAILISQWHSLIAHTISPDIANAEKVGSAKSELVFMILCSGLVAIAMKITGILLISALMILPAAIARLFSRSPEQMAIMAALFGALAVVIGLLLSLALDIPSGPAIIASAAAGFFCALILSGLKNTFF